ncbi:TetR/AcrR family transcriptional regulator [Melghirimyces algeriensis]|uniref:Transcriptional regulator, TetR family n=1 Tax=Melghirimyces algeriensis TaxID=910412 RepID=A0A521CCR5_9BACL|nr:TetR/AcrR family transcriptional regulator [Melghirimyces algeriensis]SMO57216.1 transcriptional regulator, TetR family [Melghirimyces algeriensis]
MSRSIKKEAILDTAESLFYDHGFHAIGLKKILEEANVAIMTLYNHFSSKEQLIEEILKRRESQYWLYLDSFVEEGSASPFLQVVKAHVNWLNDKGKNGCMFLRAMEEFAGTDNQIENIARNHKNKLLKYLRDLGQKSGYANDEDIAFQMTVLLEGATSMAEIVGPQQAGKQAISMAQSLLNTWRR